MLILLSCVCVAGVGWGETAADLFAQAKREQDTQARLALLNWAVERDPKLADAYHYRADVYRALQQYPQALADYTKVISLRSKDPWRYYSRALLYIDMNRGELAAADLTKALSLRPDYRDFLLARARAYMQTKNYNLALADYKKYLGKRQPDEMLAMEMIPAEVETYHYTQATALLDRAATLGNDTAALHYWRGRVFAGKNSWDEAISEYSKAINRDASFAPAYRYRANAFKAIGDLPATLDDYNALIALQPDALFFNRRGLVHEELHEFTAAAEDYTRAIELNPKWAIPYNNRGFVKMHLKDWEGAKQDLQTAISLDGAAPTPYINLAGVYWLGKKDRKSVYRYLDKAVHRNFTDFEALYDEDQKGWMFKGVNQTAEFRALLYK